MRKTGNYKKYYPEYLNGHGSASRVAIGQPEDMHPDSLPYATQSQELVKDILTLNSEIIEI